ncbi:MAG TPA: transposase [Candidatus Angelobacter sp.]
MDTSAQVNITRSTDNQAPPTAKRRYRSVEEKRRIVEKTLVKGASVARVAREHGVNANQVFAWRLLYKKNRLGSRAAKLLPATIEGTTRTKPEDKRRWSLAEKQQIVAASLEPNASVKEIAQANGVHPSLVYDWRKKYGRISRAPKVRAAGLLAVTVTDGSGPRSGETAPVRAIEIDLPKGRVRIIGADAGLLRAAMELLR